MPERIIKYINQIWAKKIYILSGVEIYLYKKKSNSESKIFLILVFIFIGSLFGSVIANNLNIFLLRSINSYIKNFFYEINNSNINKANLFVLEFIKNLKTILFLWLMAFIPLGNFFSCFILFIKGFSYGFSASMIFNIYKLKGFIYILKFIFPTSLILLPVIIIVSNYSIKLSNRLKHMTKKDLKKNISEYTFVFIMATACIVLSNLINIYLIN